MFFGEDDQVLQEPFVKQNISKPRFHLVPDTYCTKKFDILSKYWLVATTFTKAVLFREVYLAYCKGSTFPFLYLISIKAEVSKCASLSWHSQKMHNKSQKLIKRQNKEVSIEWCKCL